MTTPYVTGTVSVTAGSPTVTGIGTGWKTAGLVAGVFGLDSASGNPVPVLSVDSDTQITLAKPWRGATANEQPYWITYDTTDGQQTVNLMEKVVEYIARLNKPMLTALASLMPAADKLPYFGAGGAGALADFPAAARALLAGGVLPEAQLPARLRTDSSLISSNFNDAIENGFYKAGPAAANPPVSGTYWFVIVTRFDSTIHQEAWNDNFNIGYRRVRAANGAWGPWRLISDERGSNANGEYVRLADGTQICTRSVATGNPTLAAGEAISLGSFNYAASFVTSPSRSLSYDGSWSHTLSVGSEGGGNVGVGGVAISNRDNAAHSYAGTVYITAVGRWY
ncbi:MAG: pyocin knob domain-containing protein [Agrobacterium cavarae]